MSTATGHCFIKKFLSLKTYSIEMDYHIEFFMNVYIIFSIANVIQKQ